MTHLVIPDPDSLGIRVNLHTPLGQVVAELRRLNPRAPYTDIKRAAEEMRRQPAAPSSPAEPAELPAAVAAGPEEPPPAVVVEKPKPAARRQAKAPTSRKRPPRNEAEASMVPVEGGEPIPAEPPPAQL